MKNFEYRFNYKKAIYDFLMKSNMLDDQKLEKQILRELVICNRAFPKCWSHRI